MSGWMTMNREFPVTVPERVSRRQRFNHTLDYWKSKESLCPFSFSDFFTVRVPDRNSNKDPAESSRRRRRSLSPGRPRSFHHGESVTKTRHGSVSPVPRWLDTQSGPGIARECPSLNNFLASCDLDCDSDFNTAMESVSTQIYPRAVQAGGGDFVAMKLPGRSKRWRNGFLLMAILCFSYVGVSVIVSIFWPKTSAADGPSPRPYGPSYHYNYDPTEDGQNGETCDWDCFNYLFI